MNDWDDPQTWDHAYQLRKPVPGYYDPVILRYHRQALMPTLTRRAKALVRLLELNSSSRLVFVGAGYGWTAEILIGLVPGIAIDCTDPSPLVQARKDTSEEAEIEEQLAKIGATSEHTFRFCDDLPRARVPILEAIPDLSTGGVDWIITEDVVTCLEDGDALDLSAELNALSGNVVHIVTTAKFIPSKLDPTENLSRQHPGYNWKSVEDWKALIPGDQFVPPHYRWMV